MTRDAKMSSEGTFEPCENRTNDPGVQRTLDKHIVNVFSIDMPTFKITKTKYDFFIKKASIRR